MKACKAHLVILALASFTFVNPAKAESLADRACKIEHSNLMNSVVSIETKVKVAGEYILYGSTAFLIGDKWLLTSIHDNTNLEASLSDWYDVTIKNGFGPGKENRNLSRVAS